MPFQTGDRVRIKNPQSEYTGCRGTIADPTSAASVTVLGHLVAIDGENGIKRPFLVSDLVPLQAVRVRSQTAAKTDASPPASSEVAGQGLGRNGRSE
jgi:hypothetical protein